MLLDILQIIISLIILIILELVLSIDNILFISLVCENLKKKELNIIKPIGVILAISGRLLLLLSINWLTRINYPLFTIYKLPFSLRDIIMISGGLYLIFFAAFKITEMIKYTNNYITQKKTSSFISVLIIILIGDSLFSFDSVLTAIAIGHNITVMIIAIILSSMVLLFSINFISNFLNKYPHIKILALCFLLLVGVSLLASGFNYEFTGIHMFSIMSFAILVQYVTLKKIKKNI